MKKNEQVKEEKAKKEGDEEAVQRKNKGIGREKETRLGRREKRITRKGIRRVLQVRGR
jgi:hypothetical protein